MERVSCIQQLNDKHLINNTTLIDRDLDMLSYIETILI